MKYPSFIVALIALLGIGSALSTHIPMAWAKVRLFTVYADAGDGHSDHFIPSGWMGDHGDVSLKTDHVENPHSGVTCIQVNYRRSPTTRHNWVGVVWQHPENNWGSHEGAGIDLSATTQLTFWARGEKGGERIATFKVGGTKGPHPDSCEAEIGPITLTDTWQQHVINLAGKDLTHIISGFVWAANLVDNPHGCVFYLDDIRFE